ncbi:MAG: hypothetical protein ACYS8W_05700 [Planctomycetota bacterium]|jgi:hypothetical protein
MSNTSDGKICLPFQYKFLGFIGLLFLITGIFIYWYFDWEPRKGRFARFAFSPPEHTETLTAGWPGIRDIILTAHFQGNPARPGRRMPEYGIYRNDEVHKSGAVNVSLDMNKAEQTGVKEVSLYLDRGDVLKLTCILNDKQTYIRGVLKSGRFRYSSFIQILIGMSESLLGLGAIFSTGFILMYFRHRMKRNVAEKG